jgi:hypothetical protein
VVTIYGDTEFDTPKIYEVVDGKGNGCNKLYNLRKNHHDINKGIAVLLRGSSCAEKRIIQHAKEAGAELVIIYMEFADDDIEDFISTGSEGYSSPELTILSISNRSGLALIEQLKKSQVTI